MESAGAYEENRLVNLKSILQGGMESNRLA